MNLHIPPRDLIQIPINISLISPNEDLVIDIYPGLLTCEYKYPQDIITYRTS
jgi:hypothetical protein